MSSKESFLCSDDSLPLVEDNLITNTNRNKIVTKRKEKKVAIVISTKNRSEKLIELLKYYAEIESQHTLYIGDASDTYHINEIIQQMKNICIFITNDYTY